MRVYNDKVLAKWMGCTARRVRQLRDDGVIMEKQPDLYELQPNIVRYINYLRNGSGHAQLNDERALLTRARRETAEMDNAARRGELHSTADLEKGMQTMVLNFRNRAMVIPAKEAPKLASYGGDQAKIFDELTRSIKELLDEMSNFTVAFAIASGGDDEEDTAEND